MSTTLTRTVQLRAAAFAGLVLAGGGGYWLGSRREAGPLIPASSAPAAKILYYYDPMFPNQKFDKPGKSPFMDMQLTPKYANRDMIGGGPGVSIDPRASQNLGIRIVAAETGMLATQLDVTGSIEFNQRDVAIIQARSGAFIQHVYGRAPGDVIRARAPIADIQLPEWGGAQTEFLSVRRIGNVALTAAARRRLLLLGMSDDTIGAVERSGRASGLVTIRSPISGVIQTLEARAGASLAPGQTLAQVTGLGTVWLNAAVPEAQTGRVRVGQRATATMTAFPGETFGGRVIAILPTAQADSRTLTVRIELANRAGRLRPGMFAQVSLGGDDRRVLLIPSEAVIHTGTRTIVMLASHDGRYHPSEVRTGRESGDRTEILEGLVQGEKVVASGQFLLDSEASLTGVAIRPLRGAK